MKKSTIFTAILIALIALGSFYYLVKTNKSTIQQTQNSTKPPASKKGEKEGNSTNTPNINNGNLSNNNSTESNQNKSKTFENRFMSIKVPADWSVEELKNGSVNIKKDNYILYINPHYQQTSGAHGGRFDEIASGAPSADLVTIFHPAEPCSPLIKSNIGSFTRVDLYVDKNSNQDACKRPSDNKRHWYFSYYVKGDGYLNYIDANSLYSYVITVSVKVDNINNLPTEKDPTVLQMLKETDAIVNSLTVFK